MKSIKPATKLARILGEFARGRSLNTFEAQQLGDSCLNSTVDRLHRRYGLRLHRVCETVQGRYGAAHVTRYSLPADQLLAARRLLGDDWWAE